MMFSELIWKYIFSRSCVRQIKDAQVCIANDTRIINSRIIAAPGTRIEINEKCVIKNVEIYLDKGCLSIGKSSILTGEKKEPLKIIVNNGTVELGDHSKLACKRVWVRFGGNLSIGSYTNVNAGSEIRCDEKVQIGSFNQISYNVRIWDTNTHSILPPEERRRIAKEKFPYFGFETEKPASSPIIIGNDCWIGENSAILKGTEIGDGSIVGFGTFITNKKIPARSTALNDRQLRIIPIKD